MKTMTRPNIYLPLALVLTAALSLPVAAQKLVPFKGTMQGHDTDIGGPINAFVVDPNGTGIATHLGQFSFSQENTVNLDTGTETGSGHWIAANGDSIYRRLSDQVNRRTHPMSLASRKLTPLSAGRSIRGSPR